MMEDVCIGKGKDHAINRVVVIQVANDRDQPQDPCTFECLPSRAHWVYGGRQGLMVCIYIYIYLKSTNVLYKLYTSNYVDSFDVDELPSNAVLHWQK